MTKPHFIIKSKVAQLIDGGWGKSRLQGAAEAEHSNKGAE